MRNRLLILLGFVGLSAITVAFAQDFDDIYFDSSKSTKKEKSTHVKEQSAQNSTSYYSQNYVAERDVDEYNRRGNYYSADDTTDYVEDSTYTDDSFQYTERIKRFHNPTVVIESSDQDLVDLYVYTRPSVNIVVGTPTYYAPVTTAFTFGYYSPWSWTYYNPWDPFDYWRFNSFYYSYSWYRPHFHHSIWYPAIPHWGHGCIPHYYGWNHHPIHSNPIRYRGGDRGNRRPVAPNINRGGQTINRGNGRTRIGNVVANRPAIRPNRGTSTVNRGRGGVTFNNSNRPSSGGNRGNTTGIYRRPSTISNSSNGRNAEVQRSTQRVFNDNTQSSFNRNNSGFSSGRSSSFSGGTRGGNMSGGGAHGGGHRR